MPPSFINKTVSMKTASHPKSKTPFEKTSSNPSAT